MATCGGIARNHENGFVLALSANLGSCSVTLAELWGAYLGSYIGQRLGCRNILLELDFVCVHSFITQGVQCTHAYSSIAVQLRAYLRSMIVMWLLCMCIEKPMRVCR